MKRFIRKRRQTSQSRTEPQITPFEIPPGKIPAFLSSARQVSDSERGVLAYHLHHAIDEILQGASFEGDSISSPAQQEAAIRDMVTTTVRQIIHRELSAGRMRLGEGWRS